MAKQPNPKQATPEPEAWDRFERAVDAALHAPPAHRPKPKPEPKKQKQA